ncbi:MAG: SUMF1/EgtB/PvdO family nonheme iron enzyme [Polyangiaceae bacterium]|jgi:hypothetical protein|nr:SUMF1/EgtB/PvdO family nonheme iron enzyme [Polyangiaceae bacterium]
MRKHLAAVFLAGATLHGGAYLLLQKTGKVGVGGVFELLGCARQLTSSLVSPRTAAASPGAPAAAAPEAAASEAPVVEAKASPVGETCPAGMVLVEGEYCPEVEHTCARWMETTGRYKHYRCAEYSGARCLSKQREHRRFCIDRDEYAPPGEGLPVSRASWTDAERTCGALGKRVCLESEWNFACEGEEMRPYPYGWKRDAEACNADRVDIYERDGSLRDLRVGAGDKPRCVSPFGVHNLSGNLEEWTTIDASARVGAPRPAMKGAYWQPSRNHCRAAQTAHDRFYKGTETGFRCCADAP